MILFLSFLLQGLPAPAHHGIVHRFGRLQENARKLRRQRIDNLPDALARQGNRATDNGQPARRMPRVFRQRKPRVIAPQTRHRMHGTHDNDKTPDSLHSPPSCFASTRTGPDIADKKSLFRRHEHAPAVTGLNDRFHGGDVEESGWRCQFWLKPHAARNQDTGESTECP
ncbi:MAG: hypothetical protein O3B24_10415 [Verrucomicrobia bacterium]|nr:hypothetical protein [Verrucomicrobiota bacterium]